MTTHPAQYYPNYPGHPGHPPTHGAQAWPATAKTLAESRDPGRLACRGRLPVENQPVLTALLTGSTVQPTTTCHDSIDQCRIQNYSPQTESFLLHLGASHCPSFWGDLHISLPQLRDWLRLQGADLQWRVVPYGGGGGENDK